MNKTLWSRPYFGMAFALAAQGDGNAPPPPPPTGGTPAANTHAPVLTMAA